MKPITVFWIAYCSAVLVLDLCAWITRGSTSALIWSIIVAASLGFWIWRGVKENRLRKDMQALISDLATQLIAHKKLVIATNPQAEKVVKGETKETP